MTHTTHRRRIAILLAATMVAAGFVAVQSVVTPSPADAATYDPDRWDAGNIISDANFYDGDAMTTNEIAAFLDGKITSTTGLAACAKVATTSTPCLKDYTGTIRARASADNGCTSIAAKTNQSAASIIAIVAKACGISPKVILVTLQKEQGLVASTGPTKWGYDHAMGWGCPDTAACETTYNGLFNQVYKGSWQFKQYRYNYLNFNFRKGMTAKIQYSPSSGCGSKSVTIDNWATAALYIYTPYTPNKAALANYPGTASCGAYGNRNFWAYYNSWFGSSVVGGYIIRKSGTSTDYLVVDDTRWKMGASNTALLAAYAPYGPRGAVSSSYLASFSDAGTLGRIIENPSGYNFLVDGGKRYKVGTCDVVTDYGFGCATVPEFSWDQIGLLPAQSATLSPYIRLSGTSLSYVLQDGVKREFVDTAAATAADVSTATATVLTAASLDSVKLGVPLVSDGVLFAKTGSTDRYVKFDGTLWHVGAALQKQTKITTWLGGSAAKTLSAASIAKLPAQKEFPTIFKDATTGKVYQVGTTGLDLVANSSSWGSTIPTVPHSIVARFTLTGKTLSLPGFVRSIGTGQVYLLNKGTKAKVKDLTERTAIAKKLGIQSTYRDVPDTALASVVLADPAKKTAIAVKLEGSSVRFYLDGKKRVAASAGLVIETTGSSVATEVSRAFLLSYTAETPSMKMGVTCGSRTYVQISGKFHEVTSKTASEFKPTFGFRKMDAATCSAVKYHSKKLGTIIRGTTGKYYVVDNGKKRPMSKSTYKKLKKSLGSSVTVSAFVLSTLPTGSTRK